MAISTSGEFYTLYKTKRSHYPANTFACAETTVSALLEQETTSDHPGMLLGKVQSGKTRTFISAMAVAFDNGFDVAIILTKNSKALVEQTRKRLDDEFKEFVEEGELEVYDIMSAPSSFSKYELESKLVFVVKKQPDNLVRLTKLYAGENPSLANARTLIIDDEADNASIGYVKKAGIIEANKIAKQISDLRTVIKKVSYLQVTATPYSLYLQPEEVVVGNSESFSPTRPKFTKLVPVPDEYVGGDTYFGDSARSTEPTVESLIHVPVADSELAVLKAPDGRKFKLANALTSPAIESLRTALMTFVVGGCIQRIRGIAKGQKAKKLRFSFLIHTEAGREAHGWQERILDRLAEVFEQSAIADTEEFRTLVKTSYDDLERSIQLNGESVPTFELTLAEVREALSQEHLTIAKVNSDEDVVSLLDSSGQLKLRSPLNVFIGGQVLDRGVTLERLIGFYYGRRPNKFQQDTVLQHSRMYGYRKEDLAVTRFYTSNYIRSAMFEMELFDSSLRQAIENGQNQGVQFIHRADNGGVIPCSPNKILVATTQTLKAFRRVLPIGFQSGFKTHIKKSIDEIDQLVEANGGFNAKKPTLVSVELALQFLDFIRETLEYPEDEGTEPFSWTDAKSIIQYLSTLDSPTEPGQVWLWAAADRDSARLASESSHAKFIETPDSEKTEGRIAKTFAEVHPILFLLRQNGQKAKGWRDTPFYWPVIRAQKMTPTIIYASETVD